ncbi:MAG: amidohydrolase family protein [Bryobacteraceae bacterium]
MKIDTHHHFWKYNAAEYGWIGDDMKNLRRDFLAKDLRQALASAGVDAAISVQARETVEETRWLLEIAAAEPKILGVVGWVELAGPRVEAELDRFVPDKKFKGVRHVLQAEPANELMDDSKFNDGISKLASRNLVYDILIFERHLKQAIAFVDRHPKQVFVLDHVAKPLISAHVLEPWRRQMHELAKRPNVYCKISGMITEADWLHWSPADLAPYIATAIDAFTPRRLMFGSDWPVMLAAGNYRLWHDTVTRAVEALTEEERDRFWSGTAKEAYRL